METSLPPEPGLNAWAEQFAASLQAERDRADDFFAAEQTRLQRAEAIIEEELSRLEEQARSAAVALAEQGRKRGDDLDREAEELSPDSETETMKAAAIDQAIDVDVAVREERQRLQQLQEEWREKLRQAEIELSVERASLARQRAELEDRIRPAPGDLPQAPGTATATDDAPPPTRGHWLAKMGLSEADRVRRRKR